MSPPNTGPLVVDSVTELIGNTPLVRLNRLPANLGVEAEVYAKVEIFNASGSLKDRIALEMINEAERTGRIKPGDTLIEPTSGNTGISFALIGAVRGYKVIIVIPERMSQEKLAVLHVLGAQIIRAPNVPYDSPESFLSVARRLHQETPNSHILNQYENVGNPRAYEESMAREIWEQTRGRVSAVVVGAGTGGTITGLARGLRQYNPAVKVIAADPVGSILSLPQSLNDTGGQVRKFEVEGIGHDFVPEVLDRSVVDLWCKVEDQESFELARRLIAQEGLLVGGSSGSVLAALRQGAFKLGLGKGDTVVVVLADSIRNYLGKFVDDGWMRDRGYKL